MLLILTEYRFDQACYGIELELLRGSRVALDEPKSKPETTLEYENRMLRPGFEPGISDSKGRYA
jgi:hypothetical protein